MSQKIKTKPVKKFDHSLEVRRTRIRSNTNMKSSKTGLNRPVLLVLWYLKEEEKKEEKKRKTLTLCSLLPETTIR